MFMEIYWQENEYLQKIQIKVDELCEFYNPCYKVIYQKLLLFEEMCSNLSGFVCTPDTNGFNHLIISF